MLNQIKNALEGRDTKTAAILARDGGWTLRIMEIDGAKCMGTCDYSQNRINVSVELGKIKEVLSIG